MFYLSIKAISVKTACLATFFSVLHIEKVWHFEQASQIYEKIDLPPCIKSYRKLGHRDNVTGGMGVLPIFCHVDTDYKGIETIVIRNGTLKTCRTNKWLALFGIFKIGAYRPGKVFLLTFRRENEICMKRANHVVILQPFPPPS